MASSERLGFWSIFIDVSGDWTCVGSKDLAGLSDRNKYKAKSGSPFALLFEIIDKIKKATSATPNLPDIRVSLVPDPKGGFLIVKDPAPAAASAPATGSAATAARSGQQPKTARTMAKKSAIRKAKVHKSKPKKDKDQKSKPAKPKADDSKDQKSKREITIAQGEGAEINDTKVKTRQA